MDQLHQVFQCGSECLLGTAYFSPVRLRNTLVSFSLWASLGRSTHYSFPLITVRLNNTDKLK